MTDKIIDTPIGVWGYNGAAEQITIAAFNNSGGTLQHGDVVVVDNSAGQMPAAPGSITGAVTIANTANNQLVVGVVSVTGDCSTSAATVAAGGTCFVVIAGLARVQIGANTVTVGTHLLATAAANKTATGVAYASGVLGSVLGTPLESSGAKDANNTIRAIIKLG